MTRQMEARLTIACGLCDFSATTEQMDAGLSEAFMSSALAHADEHEQHKVVLTYQATMYSENYQDPAKPTQDAIQAELR